MHLRSLPKVLSILAFIFLTTTGFTQNPQPEPCSTPEFRQMDFWIGDWEVSNPKGEVVGTNRIEQILCSCVIMENWKGKGGSVGHSFNIYNQLTKRWEQTWVDNQGNVIYFHGQWDEDAGELVYFCETLDPTGGPLWYQMIFTPHKDGSVNQVWKASVDAGRTWDLLFDGTYRKKK